VQQENRGVVAQKMKRSGEVTKKDIHAIIGTVAGIFSVAV
jgi:hypothetical protein